MIAWATRHPFLSLIVVWSASWAVRQAASAVTGYDPLQAVTDAARAYNAARATRAGQALAAAKARVQAETQRAIDETGA